MMRSMFSGVSGLKVHQTRMDVIGNNISNVNTMGYKSQRVTFSDVFSQTLSSATGANDDTGRGGINAMQVGLGVNVSSIDMLMTQGAAQRTDNPFDLMIDGDGFIVVGDEGGRYFTRAGALRRDDDGNLVIANGMKVQGWLADEEGNITAQEVKSINLFDPKYQATSPKMTTKAQIAGNISSTESKGKQFSIRLYDSLGNSYTLPLELTPTKDSSGKVTPGSWQLSAIKAEDGKTYLSDDNQNKIEISFTPQTLTFNSDGTLASSKELTLAIANTVKGVGGSTFSSEVKIDLSGLTQYATKSTVDGKPLDGNAAGTLSGYEIGQDGIITATYTNGDKRDIAQVPIAQFDNPAGLEKVGDNLFTATTNSGDFDGIGDAGSFKTGVLEMSNVDLSSEFTDMIVTQRGFQANSRIITVSDEMLQELTNLKR